MLVRSACINTCVLLLLACSGAPSSEADPMRFRLCRTNVSTIEPARMVAEPAKWLIHVRLNSGATQNFEAITRDNIGKSVRVLYGDGETLLEAQIQAVISSGVISGGSFATQSEAAAARSQILDSSSSQCGLLN